MQMYHIITCQTDAALHVLYTSPMTGRFLCLLVVCPSLACSLIYVMCILSCIVGRIFCLTMCPSIAGVNSVYSTLSCPCVHHWLLFILLYLHCVHHRLLFYPILYLALCKHRLLFILLYLHCVHHWLLFILLYLALCPPPTAVHPYCILQCVHHWLLFILLYLAMCTPPTSVYPTVHILYVSTTDWCSHLVYLALCPPLTALYPTVSCTVLVQLLADGNPTVYFALCPPLAAASSTVSCTLSSSDCGLSNCM